MTEDDAALALRLGNSLRRHRLERGWTQAMLAEAAEISINHLSYLERGERLPSVPMLVQLARALQLTASELLGETPTDVWTTRVLALSQALSAEAKEIVMAMLQGLARGQAVVPSRTTKASRPPSEEQHPTPGKLAPKSSTDP
ncbi:MAG: XRE family transcriptional regulator [Myxococcaceae bacterium]|nr:MAG: XRE family transcriptional regulator [Myxococcaceae bacterium]